MSKEKEVSLLVQKEPFTNSVSVLVKGSNKTPLWWTGFVDVSQVDKAFQSALDYATNRGWKISDGRKEKN